MEEWWVVEAEKMNPKLIVLFIFQKSVHFVDSSPQILLSGNLPLYYQVLFPLEWEQMLQISWEVLSIQIWLRPIAVG